MASSRVSKEVAQLCPIPPHSWYWVKFSDIIKQPVVANNIHTIPINEPLKENLLKEPIRNPFLVTDDWWPIVGGQRIRALYEIRSLDPILQVARFDKPWHNTWLLWGDEDFRNKAMAIQFQMWELVFKSQWYTIESTLDGVHMTYFEELGDTLKGWVGEGLIPKEK